MKEVVKLSKFINSDSPELCRLAYLLGSYSVKLREFNGVWSAIYKYLRQCVYHKEGFWAEPPYPRDYGLFQELGISGWKDWRAFFKKHNPKTPEFGIPPECLFPWKDDEPSAMEVLEETYAENQLNVDIMEEILEDLLIHTNKEYTFFDYLVSETDSRACFDPKAAKLIRDGKDPGTIRLTMKKYSGVTDWFQDPSGHRDLDYGLRCSIWKRPTETRDASILTPSLGYRVWLTNKKVGDSLGKRIKRAEGVSSSFLNRWRKGSQSFIYTDWRKSGLTLPHYFVKLVNKVLKEKFDLKIDFPEDGFPIYDRETKKLYHNKTNGYSLGMVNNYATLFTAVLFEYAKRIGIFDENDDILVFNDDSVIKTSAASKYYRWVNLCDRAGAALDKHKTVQTDEGILFCELYCIKMHECNTKLISLGRTMLSKTFEAINYHHWRFLVTTAWNATMRLPSKRTQDQESLIARTAEWLAAILVQGCQDRFQKIPEDLEKPPELGGVNFGAPWHSRWGLKDYLIRIERYPAKYTKDKIYLLHSRQAASWRPTFAPWRKFPKGEIYNAFEQIAEGRGYFGELSTLSRKLRNEFILDSEWFKTQYWSHFAETYPEGAHMMSHSEFFEVARGLVWKNYAIPEAFVTGEMTPEHEYIPFLGSASDDPQENYPYTLMSTMAAYIMNQKEGGIKLIPPNQLNLGKWFHYQTPISIEATNNLAPLSSLKLISQLQTFRDPKVSLTEYFKRTGLLITSMNTVDHIGKNALTMMKVAFPREDFSRYSMASWWTRCPMPIKEEWIPQLSGVRIEDQLEAIQCLHLNTMLPEHYQVDLDTLVPFLQHHSGVPKRYKHVIPYRNNKGIWSVRQKPRNPADGEGRETSLAEDFGWLKPEEVADMLGAYDKFLHPSVPEEVPEAHFGECLPSIDDILSGGGDFLNEEEDLADELTPDDPEWDQAEFLDQEPGDPELDQQADGIG
jgi:hypothetical protein